MVEGEGVWIKVEGRGICGRVQAGRVRRASTRGIQRNEEQWQLRKRPQQQTDASRARERGGNCTRRARGGVQILEAGFCFCVWTNMYFARDVKACIRMNAQECVVQWEDVGFFLLDLSIDCRPIFSRWLEGG
jgi:hypothetical protein